MFSSRNYAIGMAHFKIAGGWKSLGYLCAGYVALIGLVAGLIAYMSRGNPLSTGDLQIFARIVLGVEAFILIIFGSMRVSTCIRTDIMSNMIESHRLMPIPSWRAMLGYLLGTTVHPLALTVINAALVYTLAMYSGMRAMDIGIGQGVLFVFAIFVWSFTAMGTMMFRQFFAVSFLLIMLGTCASVVQQSFTLLPGMALIFSPFIGNTIFMIGSGGLSGSVFRWAYPVSFIAQGAFFGVFFVGACRRYRGTFATTLNAGQGILLAAFWTALSITAILGWNYLRIAPRWASMNFEVSFKHVQMIASLAVGMLLAIVPLNGLVGREKRVGVNPLLSLVVCAGTIAVVVPLGWTTSRFLSTGASAGIATTAMIAGYVVIVYFTLRLLKRATPGITLLGVGMMVGAMWVLPLLAEMVRWFFWEKDWSSARLGVIATFSPMGLLASQWTTEEPVTPVVGIAGLWALAILLMVLVLRRDRRENAMMLTAAG